MLFINESPWHSLQHKSETLQWRVLWRGVRFTFHFLLVILIRGRRYSPQTPSCVQQHVFFRGPSVPRCKCVHLYNLKNLRHIYTYIYFFFFCLIISRGKGAEQISIWGGGSGSWKRFTIREQIWYRVWESGPRTAVLSGKKIEMLLYLPARLPISHRRSNFFSDLITSSDFFPQLFSLPPPSLSPLTGESSWTYINL